MQCQSCGTDIKKAMKHCPACGEETTSAFTASLAANSRPTDELESGFIRANLTPKPPVSNSSDNPITGISPINGIAAESRVTGSNGNGVNVNNTNGKVGSALFSTPLPQTVAVNDPPPPPQFNVSAPINTANGIHTREAMPPTDIIRANITCRKCHSELKAGAKFCSVCGTSSEPSALSKVIDFTQQTAQQVFSSLQRGLRGTTLSTAALILLGLTGVFALMAVVQYLIPAGVDAEKDSQLIYHLRSIQFLLAALISVVASLVVNRR